ncbi:M56 family metallopeptidase [Autumnicola musiva]|uniref:M56 family metallopeptidase n=1 Tax=Autumnicola musiva TaxID=3075589 RepID=A0ABU3D732_9FLAO|nr:M56 family metallopeptidase [Zunongwangia sp. F117]MDT0677241.1 M56 family metallopeptidase [Zunongwangia sp. F117]
MIIYLLKSALCLLLLFAFYKTALENEKIHNFKRFYLLGSLLFSMILPLITFSYHTEAIEIPAKNHAVPVIMQNAENSNFQHSVWNVSDFIPEILWTVYGIGFAILGIRFLRNLMHFGNKISLNEKVVSGKFINVLLPIKTAPHSFLKYIFLNKKDFEENKISTEILKHEQAHVSQKHSWDILIIEFLQVIFWFNPLFLFFKKSIQINHEFLADEEVISSNTDAFEYSQLLLNYSAGSHHSGMSSAFNHSLTRLTIFGKKFFIEKPGRHVKKRILMISKPFSGKRMAARLSLLLPVIALCLLFFNNEIVAKPPSGETINNRTFMSNFKEQVQQENSFQQKRKSISILIGGESVLLNDEKAKLEDFRKKLNSLTRDWTEEEIANANLNISISNAEKGFLQKLNKEYLETRFAKIKGGSLLPSPPPESPHKDFPAPPPPPAMEDANATAPPAPPVPDSIYSNRKMSQAMRLHYSKDSVRIEEMMERRMALMQERQKEMEQRQKDLQKRQKEMQKRMETSEEMRAKMEERREEFEQRRIQMEKRRDSVYKIIRDSIR